MRARVFEEAYGVRADLPETDENGEEVFRSDRIAAAIRISQTMKAIGRDSMVIEDGPAVSVRVPVSDTAPDSELDEVAGELLEAAGGADR